MDHADHVTLLQNGIRIPGGIWADFGAGRGAFTLALADLIGPSGVLYAVDKNAMALRANARLMHARFPEVRIHYEVRDYTQPWILPPLDGIVMANTLHFHSDQPKIVRWCRRLLRPGGTFLLVEYNVEQAHPAVPHPVPYSRWRRMAEDVGFGNTALLSRRPSRFLHEIYSAGSW